MCGHRQAQFSPSLWVLGEGGCQQVSLLVIRLNWPKNFCLHISKSPSPLTLQEKEGVPTPQEESTHLELASGAEARAGGPGHAFQLDYVT